MAHQDEIRGAQAQVGGYGHLIGYTAEDAGGEKIGMVKAVWEDEDGRLAYLGIAMGWLGLGRIHVVPAQDAALSESGHRIRLPFAARAIKAAPDFEADYDITPDGERIIREYYGDPGSGSDADFNPDPGDPSLYTGRDRNPARESDEPARSDWSARTDAPMAYGQAIGGASGRDEPDRSLAEPETIEEEPEARDEGGRPSR